MAMIPVPAGSPITQTYRQNATIYNAGSFHGAIDFAVPVGTDIVAPEDGVVVFDGWAWDLPGGPNDWHLRWYLIKPDRGNTRLGGGIITVFRNASGSHWGVSHASKSYFSVGDRIVKGQVIQQSGNTGSSTGPHTHINLWPAKPDWNNGGFGAIDPQPWLTEAYRKIVPGAPADASGATMHGIDYSNHQPTLNAAAVPSDFIGVLATDGATFKSPTLDRQMPAALKRTKRTMVYHFARVGQSDSDTQAKHFLKAAKKYIAAGAVPVLDWEEDAWNHRADWAIDWIRYVEKATGRQVWVYQRQAAAAHPSWGSFRRPMWLSWYASKARVDGYRASFVVPPVPGWDVVLWQYTDNGWLPGFNGPLDLNVAFGDPWKLAVAGTGSATKTKEWYEMATLDPEIAKQIDGVVRDALDTHWRHKRELPGSLMEGRTGSFESIALWQPHDIKNINEKLDLILHALSGPRITEIVKNAGLNISAEELVTELLRQIATPKEA